jgi:hypothetical protein
MTATYSVEEISEGVFRARVWDTAENAVTSLGEWNFSTWADADTWAIGRTQGVWDERDRSANNSVTYNGYTIDAAKLMDGIADLPDGSDEDEDKQQHFKSVVVMDAFVVTASRVSGTSSFTTSSLLGGGPFLGGGAPNSGGDPRFGPNSCVNGGTVGRGITPAYADALRWGAMLTGYVATAAIALPELSAEALLDLAIKLTGLFFGQEQTPERPGPLHYNEPVPFVSPGQNPVVDPWYHYPGNRPIPAPQPPTGPGG